jgi:LmbE family N-acetylglucosaminyl deacetylase
MLSLGLGDLQQPLTMLCLGAHSDDLEIGCGGTLLRLVAERTLSVNWVVLGCTGARAQEARQSAEALLQPVSQRKIATHSFRDAFFPHEAREIKEVFEKLKSQVSPDVVFTHARHDLHQDHRVVHELTWNTFRDHLILEYEIPKYDGDFGSPNFFVPLDAPVVDRKIRHLLQHFPSQRDKHWFDEETFRGILRLRGLEAGTRYAEGFFCRKMSLGNSAP